MYFPQQVIALGLSNSWPQRDAAKPRQKKVARKISRQREAQCRVTRAEHRKKGSKLTELAQKGRTPHRSFHRIGGLVWVKVWGSHIPTRTVGSNPNPPSKPAMVKPVVPLVHSKQLHSRPLLPPQKKTTEAAMGPPNSQEASGASRVPLFPPPPPAKRAPQSQRVPGTRHSGPLALASPVSIAPSFARGVQVDLLDVSVHGAPNPSASRCHWDFSEA